MTETTGFGPSVGPQATASPQACPSAEEGAKGTSLVQSSEQGQ